MSDLQPYKVLMLNLAEYFAQTLTENQLRMYAQVLSQESVENVKRAIVEITSDPAISRMPLPAAVLAKINPPETDDATARTVAARILAAVSRFGWSNPERARMYVGEVGWTVVGLQGGWTQICQVLDESNITTFQAQWRDLAISVLRRSRAGTLDTAPALPGNKGPTPVPSLTWIKSMPS